MFSIGKAKKSGGVEWILVCLGNPGDRYENTRHNIGFMTADAIGERVGKPIQRLKYKALTNRITLGGQDVLIMKPVTYMNLSGEAAREAAQFYHLPPERVLVICDDVSLPLGKIRVRAQGSAGGHNGLRSLIAQLHSDQFPRIRLGVGGKPHPDYDMADWVLGHFSKEDQKTVRQMVERACDAAECVLSQGVQAAMNRFNG